MCQLQRGTFSGSGAGPTWQPEYPADPPVDPAEAIPEQDTEGGDDR